MQIRHIKVENFRGIKELDWHVPSDFVCIIGKGDSCKTTILDAIELGLTPNTAVSIDDSDFYNMDVTKPIVIQISIGDFENSRDLERLLLSETNYGLYIRGYKDQEIFEEPDDDHEKLITIEFWANQELEPEWRVIAPGRHEPKTIRKAHLDKFGTAKLGSYADWHFTWSKNSMISRLLGKDVKEVNNALATIGRNARKQELDIKAFEEQAKELEKVVNEFGVNTQNYAPKLDIQALAVRSGGLSLHDDGVPIKRYGTGTKRLIALAIQKKLNDGKSIRLIDEIEHGLEPFRVTQAVKKIKDGQGQTFVTTHSPTVLREASLDNLVVFHAVNGKINCVSLSEGLDEQSKSNLQGTLRTHAESFLSHRIIVCEGQTEIGLSRALDTYRNGHDSATFSANGIALLCAGGFTECAPIAQRLKKAGYDISILCDSDQPLTTTPDKLLEEGISVFKWANEWCTEQAIFNAVDKNLALKIMLFATEIKSYNDMRSAVIAQVGSAVDVDYKIWDWESDDFRIKVGKAASNGSWFKSVRHGEELGNILFSDLAGLEGSNFNENIEALNTWCD